MHDATLPFKSLNYTSDEIVAIARYLLVEHADHPAYAQIQPGQREVSAGAWPCSNNNIADALILQGLVATITVLLDRTSYSNSAGAVSAANEVEAGYPHAVTALLKVLKSVADCDPHVPKQLESSLDQLLQHHCPPGSHLSYSQLITHATKFTVVLLTEPPPAQTKLPVKRRVRFSDEHDDIPKSPPRGDKV